MTPLEHPAGLVTVGHGALDRVALGDLVRGADVASVVDVRRFPGSRTNPDVRRDALGAWLPEIGVDYRWEERLGGRRAESRGASVEDPWWTVAAFRAYARYTRTAQFRAALAEVLVEAGGRRVAVMCSESVWWRCHRRLVADVATLGHGAPVHHLMPDGRLAPHRPAEGARVGADGLVVWDGATPPQG